MMKYLIFIILIAANVFHANTQDDSRSKKNAKTAYNNAVKAIISENYEEAYTLLSQSLADDPSEPQTMLTLAKVKIEMGMIDQAINDFHLLADQDPSKGEYLFYLGYLQFNGDTSTSVLTFLDKSISLGYATPEVFYYRGLCKYLKEDYQGSIADFSKTIEKEGNNYVAYHDRGSAKRLLGDMQGALYDFRMATNLNHDFPVAFNNMGSVKIVLGDYEGAIQDYSVAINLDSAFVISYNNRGAAYYHLGRMEEALSDFEQAIMLEESYIPAIINKAATFSQNMKYTEAIAILDDIIDNASRNGIAYLNRGLVRELSGDLKGACEDWHKAISYGIAEAENFIKECK